MSNEELIQFSRLEKRGDSDHYPILKKFIIAGKTQIINQYTRRITNRYPTESQAMNTQLM